MPLGVCAGTLMGADMVGPPLQGPSGARYGGPIKGPIWMGPIKGPMWGAIKGPIWGPIKGPIWGPIKGPMWVAPLWAPHGGAHPQGHF